MSLKYFYCPDRSKTEVKECLEQCPRPEGRCLSLPSLMTIGSIRKWKGYASTTQLINPTRIEFLQITQPYAIDPFKQGFSLLGTRHHGRLEAVARKIEGLQPELHLTGEITGILDLLEPINNQSDTYRLIDYKTFGSRTLANILNLIKNNGHDMRKLQLQLGNYRLKAIPLNFDITELKCQVTVRDGSTRSAIFNKIYEDMYMVSIEILPDDEITEYFLSKDYALQQALKTGITEVCNYDDRWGGTRCKRFCPVFEYCPEGAMIHKIPVLPLS